MKAPEFPKDFNHKELTSDNLAIQELINSVCSDPNIFSFKARNNVFVWKIHNSEIVVAQNILSYKIEIK